MKIIYDNIIFNIQNYGGVSRYFSEIISRIAKFSGAGVSIFKGMPAKLSRLNPILLDLKLRGRNFDIYHPTYYSPMVKKRSRVKTVVTVHDMTHELFLSNIKIHSNGIPTKKKCIISADHIICVSYNTKKDLQKIYGIEDSRISVIYHGTPFTYDKLQEYKVNGCNKPYLLYVGRRAGYKNFNALLNAFAALDIAGDFDLICFGGGRFTNEESREFKKLNLEKAIKYIEGPPELLKSHYENAFVLVYPSLYEGFGIPVIEAMYFGCPVIASNSSAIPEVAGGAALLFSAHDAGALSDSIRSIINDNKLRNDFIEKGKVRAGFFSWDKAATQTLEVYRKLLNENG